VSLVLKGRQGKTLTVQGHSVRISKEGLFSSNREKVIPIRTVTSVEVKQPGTMFAGFIQFSLGGAKARDSSFSLTGGAMDAAQDENSIVFNGDDNYQIALRIRDYVEKWNQAAAAPAASSSHSIADELRKLKALLDDGILSQAEFDSQKRKLLGG
jgi:hypothetical protein